MFEQQLEQRKLCACQVEAASAPFDEMARPVERQVAETESHVLGVLLDGSAQ